MTSKERATKSFIKQRGWWGAS